jgi:Outer membrane efflux protein
VRVTVYNFGVTATQTLYNELQTNNRTRQPEQQVLAAREMLRSTEHAVLFNGATAYVKLLRDVAILELQRSNVNVLEVTLRQTRDRFAAGEVTRTDVAQAESSLAAGLSQLAAAEPNYVTRGRITARSSEWNRPRAWHPALPWTGSRPANLTVKLVGHPDPAHSRFPAAIPPQVALCARRRLPFRNSSWSSGRARHYKTHVNFRYSMSFSKVGSLSLLQS